MLSYERSIPNKKSDVNTKYSLQPVEDENELLKKGNRRLEEINRALRYGVSLGTVPDDNFFFSD